MLSDICYQQIRDDFWMAKYAELDVLIMKDCGWVNASKLCNDGGKRFRDWKRLEQSKRLIHALENELKHPSIEASKNTHGINSEKYLTCEDGVAQICATPSNTIKFVQDDNSAESGRLICGGYVEGK